MELPIYLDNNATTPLDPRVLEAMLPYFTNKFGNAASRNHAFGWVAEEAVDYAREQVGKLIGCTEKEIIFTSGATEADNLGIKGVFEMYQDKGNHIITATTEHKAVLDTCKHLEKLGAKVTYLKVKEDGLIDYAKLEEIALAERPKLIICGASAYSREWDYAFIRSVADKIGALVLADISHPAGMIARGLLANPLPHCHIVTTTTHKTLRGPRGGMIMMGKDFENPFGLKTPKGETRMMSSVLDMAVFPGTQGGPLEHVIAAKAIAFGEALSDDYLVYIKQVQANAQSMAKAFVAKGYGIISGGTDNHLMLIDLRNKNITGKVAENALEKADITVNKNMVPFDDKSPFVTSGIRVGTAAITTRGFKESDMDAIVDLIDQVIVNPEDEAHLNNIKKQVTELVARFPLYK